MQDATCRCGFGGVRRPCLACCERVEFWLKPQFRSIGIAPGGADQMPPVVASMRRKGAEMMR